MGIIIEKYAANKSYDKQFNSMDHFATDADGRLVPKEGETFEIMPLESLSIAAFICVKNYYQPNPFTSPEMRWEVGFSQSRVSFFTPDSRTVLGKTVTEAGKATLGFFYYSDLRSVSLGAANEPGGPYVSMVFTIQTTPLVQVPSGVRVHGSIQNLQAFVTMLTARLLESYCEMSAQLSLDIRELGDFFAEASAFNFMQGAQTDYFINAEKNAVRVTKQQPNSPMFS